MNIIALVMMVYSLLWTAYSLVALDGADVGSPDWRAYRFGLVFHAVMAAVNIICLVLT